MCTAISYKAKDFYFGRTLDYECSYGEEVVITPRHYQFSYSHMGECTTHYAMIGMAHVAEEYPLYYEAVNEKGLGMAGLNFVGNACYGEYEENAKNVATYEFIPWVLGACESVEQVRDYLVGLNLIGETFAGKYPASSLHWLIADEKQSITVEMVEEGLRIYDNPVGVLTNNPPFDKQMFNLNNYINLSPKSPKNNFSDKLNLNMYSRGMGSIGLPGDLSSQSRFVRAAFVKTNSLSGETESESVSQFFHILGAVEQQKGCCEVTDGKFEYTIYTSCCNGDKGIYYYTAYENHQITGVDMNKENLNSDKLICYPLIQGEQIKIQNQ
mgnify:CR=1 FL=1